MAWKKETDCHYDRVQGKKFNLNCFKTRLVNRVGDFLAANVATPKACCVNKNRLSDKDSLKG